MQKIAGRSKLDGPAERRLAFHYTLAAMSGFATDALVLKVLMSLGAEAAEARAVSLVAAMQVTFLINGFFVFRRLNRRSWPRQWVRYMLTGGIANTGNYFAFVTLISLHAGVLSNRWTALGISSILAWAVNYVCTRFLVFKAHPAAPGAEEASGG
jgi:putative flippase GtrA